MGEGTVEEEEEGRGANTGITTAHTPAPVAELSGSSSRAAGESVLNTARKAIPYNQLFMQEPNYYNFASEHTSQRKESSCRRHLRDSVPIKCKLAHFGAIHKILGRINNQLYGT